VSIELQSLRSRVRFLTSTFRLMDPVIFCLRASGAGVLRLAENAFHIHFLVVFSRSFPSNFPAEILVFRDPCFGIRPGMASLPPCHLPFQSVLFIADCLSPPIRSSKRSRSGMSGLMLVQCSLSIPFSQVMNWPTRLSLYPVNISCLIVYGTGYRKLTQYFARRRNFSIPCIARSSQALRCELSRLRCLLFSYFIVTG